MNEYIIGVDEAGRGPLAGPVTSAAVLIPKNFKLGGSSPDSGPRDSKKYTELQRDRWFSFIDSHPHLTYEYSSVWPKVIDRINIANAANLASTRAVKRLISRNDVNTENTEIILDGSLKLKSRDLNYEAIIRGDETELPIQLASIIAKVKRDNSMDYLHRKHKKYKFNKHKGYGTREHRSLIKKHGTCEYHRLTFSHD